SGRGASAHAQTPQAWWGCGRTRGNLLEHEEGIRCRPPRGAAPEARWACGVVPGDLSVTGHRVSALDGAGEPTDDPPLEEREEHERRDHRQRGEGEDCCGVDGVL